MSNIPPFLGSYTAPTGATGSGPGGAGTPTQSPITYSPEYGGAGSTIQVPTGGGVNQWGSGTENPADVGANPFSASAINSAQNSGNMSTALGSSGYNQAGNLNSGANTAMSAGNTLLNNAFDPNQAQYNQALTNTNNQTNVQEAQRGLAMSPYGAGMAATNLNNFNIGWNAQQLTNQNNALGTYSGALNAANTASTGASNVGTAAAANTAAGGTTALNQYNSQQQTGISDYIAAANTAAQSAQLNQGQEQINQQQYPITLAQQSIANNGGQVPFIPQTNNTFGAL